MFANSRSAVLHAKRTSARRLIKQVSQLPAGLNAQQWAVIASIANGVVADTNDLGPSLQPPPTQVDEAGAPKGSWFVVPRRYGMPSSARASRGTAARTSTK
jgi:hypothetical protein